MKQIETALVKLLKLNGNLGKTCKHVRKCTCSKIDKMKFQPYIDNSTLVNKTGARGKKMQKNYNKLTKQWQISPCKNLGLAPPSCPVPHSDQSLESRLLSCIQTPKKGFQHLHCSQMGPLLDIGVLQGTFFCMWVPFFVQGLRFLQQTKECKKTVKACIFC